MVVVFLLGSSEGTIDSDIEDAIMAQIYFQDTKFKKKGGNGKIWNGKFLKICIENFSSIYFTSVIWRI